ncbi:D-glycerate dehydrogenase [Candidatus Bipolaricaulota bacterium]|nr:D-glycerate dehydrogenase [Candidatus Bipolaricaulota bacterium]
MANIVITGELFADAVDRLIHAGHSVIHRAEPSPIHRDELLAAARDADALICLVSDRIDEQMLARSPNLRIIANVAVGYENIDTEAAKRHGISVTNTPDVLTETTADLTVGLMLAVARQIAGGDRDVRAGRFGAWGLLPLRMGTDVHGKALGIVGMGRIGTAVARRGRFGFGMHVLYYDRGRNFPAEQELGAVHVPLDRLLQQSDFVCIHVPLTPSTHHMFGAPQFRRMKRTAYLINVARGPIVDEEALVEALHAGWIAGAGLDVYENEPSVHPALIALDNRTVLLPHIGSATRETRRAMAHIAVDNVLAQLSGRQPPNLVPDS